MKTNVRVPLIVCLSLGLWASPAGLQAQSQTLPNLQQAGTSVVDDVKGEIEGILGEIESDIMGGIKDAVMNFINSQIANLLGASPLASVEKLKQLMKDAHSKLQKVEYQSYKVDYEEQKVNTTLSQNFVDYYKEINLKEDLESLGRAKYKLNQYANNKLLSPDEKAAMAQAIDVIGGSDAIVDEVKTACNTSPSGQVWMSTAERMQVLDNAKKEIAMKRQMMMKLTSQLANVYAGRLKELTQTQTASGWFDENSTLNRTVQSRKKLF